MKDKFQRMLSLQQRLGDWELVRPGRELLKEGMLQKISRKGVSFCQRSIFGHLCFFKVGPRYFILLSDCLLYCEYQGSGKI